jgi:aerobic-type carbon monoxide dehydrogenase small subunit (CoxS/CutS family)
MSEKEKKKETLGISRREFLRDAGILAGGAAIGSTVLLAACKGGEVTKTITTTTTAPGATQTVTTTVPGGTGTQTVTTTSTSVVSKYVDPIDGSEWPTLQALQEHFAAAHPGAALPGLTTLKVNGTEYHIVVKEHWSLGLTLRDQLGLFGTKIGCDMGQCGACTVLADGVPVLSCIMLAIEVGDREITTIEGLSDGITMSPLQQKFYDQNALQCGYCTPGFIMAAQGLLNANPTPNIDDARLALSGHICMCQNIKRTVEAVVGGV